ncbi:MAG: 3-methyl-2-oxobutanoate hydroxymethyltransferase [Chloroflexi bacterium]|nr:3-methyl-2-oxobutanoate hydroxymethyltransferase [Chloroflexota bacterium]MCI0781413.1 3-methyl-2-oxobutanoate hydroxymethyltransferase [Chloroflexota bacterium]MCI0794252.1 3-methyl-2-oxobutanoate hydroxymethyltransferase [Chloroflexota bacterium]MCI0799195.1 3-methyl-2-oxobutanoate hydroxymethyltransferase [Chloroflexota bacterium]MCI0824413.1 3-methyl-2-oxobutanoate hydroxymethyltransferase [Chloroflexota bacterium]
MAKITVRDIAQMKAKGEKIPMVTAYDYTAARLADEAGIPLLLVGDSLGMVVLGYDSTIQVTMEDVLHHLKAVVRGAKNAMVVADLPFMSYQISIEQALTNSARLIQEGGAHSVKLEGGERVAATVERIVQCGIPVMGHIGLTPQSINALGGYRVQGRGRRDAARLLQDAQALQEAGAYAVVLELVPTQLAGLISQRLSIPTIGIGAGPECDGQVQVLHDMLGLYTEFVPKHAKQYAKLGETMREALARYAHEVGEGTFPTEKESSTMDESILEELAVLP